MDDSIKNKPPDPNAKKQDNSFERRSGLDRRYFSYAAHIPEKRSGNDKRNTTKRRVQRDRRFELDRRALIESWSYTGPERRILKVRRSGETRRSGG